MSFSSLEFLCWFLPLFLAIYYLLPHRWRNGAICLYSLAFYAYGTWGHPGYSLLLLGSVAICYGCGRLIAAGRHPRLWLIAGIAAHLGALFCCKYAAFAAENLNRLLTLWGAAPVPVPSVPLPPGISFFTFQAIAYLADVYRGTTAAETDPVDFSVYMLLFPRLLSGPIVRYETIRPQLRERRVTVADWGRGARYFIGGLGAKVLLANRLSGLWSAVEGIGYESLSTPLAWLGLVAFSLQLYFDFYGYSLMAIGLGQWLGFSLPDNFRHPYTARSMTDFWRRWHITLGMWFRDYVYIPLGGSRRGFGRTVLNLLCVWLLTGLWHGAAWHYVLWGLFLFLLLTAEKAGLRRLLERSRVVSRLYMLLAIPLSWMLFAVPRVRDIAVYAGRLVGIGGVNVYSGDFLKYFRQYGVFVLLGLVCATPLPERTAHRLRKHPVWLAVLLAAVLAAAIYNIYQGLNDPFMYFQF